MAPAVAFQAEVTAQGDIRPLIGANGGSGKQVSVGAYSASMTSFGASQRLPLIRVR